MRRSAASRDEVRVQVLQGILWLTQLQGFPPSYRQLSEYIGSAHSNIWYAVEQLRHEGLVRPRNDNKTARALIITDAGREVAKEKALARWRVGR